MLSLGTAYGNTNLDDLGVRGGDHGSLLTDPDLDIFFLEGDGVSILSGVRECDWSWRCLGVPRSGVPQAPEATLPAMPGEVGPPWKCCSAHRSSSFSDCPRLRSSSL
mmetsp:Transcript_54258/g.168285  ORF Transcript_54258/g.168285 Transcript_54258/m.168285 type:complete len:107 (-) Transcript_54258:963-1283(-)